MTIDSTRTDSDWGSQARKRATLSLAALIFVGAATAQDLPPGVLLHSRVKNHIQGELQSLYRISCLETVRRERQPPRGKMRPLDTVRLEVLTTDDKELFASPGDRKFSEQHPLSYAGSGTLSNGLFGPYLRDIVLGGAVTDEYKGEEEVGGRRLARYDYRVPPMFSGQMIHMLEGSGRVGLHGSYWVDPQTYDVIRLEMNADNFPPTLPVAEFTTSISYVRTRLGNDGMALLPEAADVRLVKESGEINHNQVEFTHCRVFGAESTIDFSAPDAAEPAPRFATVSVDDTLRPLPEGLQIAVKLRSRLSGDTAVGTLIEGVVADNVPAKHAVIPAGSPVRGRVRRMERYTEPFPYFIIGLEFTEVEVEGIRHLFYADLVEINRTPRVDLTLNIQDTATTETNAAGVLTRKSKESILLYNLPGVATFFYRGAKLDLPQDFRTVWKTRPLK
ncbi:MAG TPA: hypothetical protein VG096_03590 [Bryobacteraceae bacterium]|nr:hypothetical protein [Bryobacteraceae bacterium]